MRSKQFPIIDDGKAVWSWVHVEDAAAAAVLALSQGNSGTYNIVDENPSQISVWLPAYARWLAAPPPVVLPRAKPMMRTQYTARRACAALPMWKAKHELGFRPQPLEWFGGIAAKERTDAPISPGNLVSRSKWTTRVRQAETLVGIGPAQSSRLTKGIR